jgi:hypothetical protein
MFTIIETPTFEADARKIWTEEERNSLATPSLVVAGSGKRGGVRVIYFTRLANGEIWLLVIYKKAVKENIPAHILKSIREVLENE